MMKLSDFREDLTKQKEGAPIYIGDAVFYVARWGTVASNKAIEKIKRELYGIFPDPKEIKEIEVYAHWLINYGLVDWEGVQDEEGKELKCEPRIVKKVFTNEEYWGQGGLVHQLIIEAMNYENYLHEQIDEDTEAVKK